MKLFDPPQLTGKYLDEVLKSKWLTTGPMCKRLKDALEGFLGVGREHIVLASSATAGFQAIMDKVTQHATYGAVYITKSTWPGMIQVIKHSTWRPFHYLNSDLSFDVKIYTSIGGARLIDDVPKLPCFIPYTHPGITIHDACHSWLPTKSNDYAVMSFYPTKLVPGAEGGVVYCRDAGAAEPIERRLYCGLHPGGGGLGETPSCIGRKANMTDVQAALNLEALELAPQYIEDIRDCWEFMRYLAVREGIPFREQTTRPYLFQIETDNASGLMRFLLDKHIPSAWNFPPAGLVTVPCHPGLSIEDGRRVIETVARWRDEE